MGYNTEFYGSFELSEPLSFEHKNYLRKFADTRRMRRNESILSKFKDPIREAVGLPVGVEGEYFVGGTGNFGQDHDESILDYNDQPRTQPCLWCQWVPSEDGTKIEWNGAEKFYGYIQWIEYLLKNFLIPWGYNLNGTVHWRGEEFGDDGKIVVKDNVVSVITSDFHKS